MDIPVTLSFHRQKPKVENDMQNQTPSQTSGQTPSQITTNEQENQPQITVSIPTVIVNKDPVKMVVIEDTVLSPIKNIEYAKSMMISLLLVVIMFMILYVMGMGVYYNS